MFLRWRVVVREQADFRARAMLLLAFWSSYACSTHFPDLNLLPQTQTSTHIPLVIRKLNLSRGCQ